MLTENTVVGSRHLAACNVSHKATKSCDLGESGDIAAA